MATRIFCDHCGNTIAKPNIFCYGPWTEVQQIAYTAGHGASGGLLGAVGAVGVGGPTVSTVAVEKLTQVDLCNTCVSVWMMRVRNLTKVSDADA